MPAFPLFDLNRTSQYPSDFATRLAAAYNKHEHTRVNLGNFLAAEIQLGDTVGFVGTSGISDPFSIVLNPTLPLTVLEIFQDRLVVNRNATADSTGTLSYVVNSQVKTIPNAKATANSAVIELIVSNEPGSLDPQLLNKLLVRTSLIDSPLAPEANSVLPPTFPNVGSFELDLDPSNSYLIEGSNPTENPTLTLQRGKSYTFALSSVVRANDHFNIVSQVRDPNAGLDLYPFGYTIEANGNVTFKVPYDAPSELYYQSRTTKYIYGRLSINAGTLDPSQPLLTAWQSSSIVIPATLPEARLYMTLGNPSSYRAISWIVSPTWENNAAGDAFLQLQYTDGSSIYPLSQVVRIQTLNKQSVSNLIANIIPFDATVYCAVYGTQNLNRLTQQLTTIDVIA